MLGPDLGACGKEVRVAGGVPRGYGRGTRVVVDEVLGNTPEYATSVCSRCRTLPVLLLLIRYHLDNP